MAKKRATKKDPRKRRARHPMDAQVVFACRPKQKENYLKASDKEEMELSEWIRKVLDEAADRALKSDT